MNKADNQDKCILNGTNIYYRYLDFKENNKPILITKWKINPDFKEGVTPKTQKYISTEVKGKSNEISMPEWATTNKYICEGNDFISIGNPRYNKSIPCDKLKSIAMTCINDLNQNIHKKKILLIFKKMSKNIFYNCQYFIWELHIKCW